MAMLDGKFRASLMDAMAKASMDDGVSISNSLEDILVRAGSRIVTNTVPVTEIGAPGTVDLFTVAGPVAIYGLYGIFKDVTDVADIEAVYIDAWDGAVAIEITDSLGVNCDGVSLGALLLKTQDNSIALQLLNADQINIDETDARRVIRPFILNAKNGATNKIRMRYDSAAGCDCDIEWVAEWRCLNAFGTGSVVEA